MKYRKIFFTALLVSLVNQSWAEDKWYAAKVIKVYPHADNRFAIVFEQDAPDLD